MALQGTLDGLCGPYAIINAYHQCDIEEDWLGEDIFRIACSSIAGWPNVLWKGTTFAQIVRMLKACQEALKNAYMEANCYYPIRVNYPFYRKLSNTSDEYWRRFSEVFSRDDVLCGIVAMEHPDKYLFTFIKGRNSLLAIDSSPISWGIIQRIRLENIHAGVYRMNEYVVNLRELIVFREALPS